MCVLGNVQRPVVGCFEGAVIDHDVVDRLLDPVELSIECEEVTAAEVRIEALEAQALDDDVVSAL